uniref:Putative conserved secreted protein n=1 Tax=Rhipicephalus microplus TaxID=6941 RepID=A0A6G5A5J6_RHIMP
MFSRRVAFSIICVALVLVLGTQEAHATKLKKLAKIAIIGAALGPRVIPVPVAYGHHAHHTHHAHYAAPAPIPLHGWHGGWHGGWHAGWQGGW